MATLVSASRKEIMGWLKNNNELKRARIRQIYRAVELVYPESISVADVESQIRAETGTIGTGALTRLLERLVAHGYIYSQWGVTDKSSRPRRDLLLNPQLSSSDLEYTIQGIKIISWTFGWR